MISHVHMCITGEECVYIRLNVYTRAVQMGSNYSSIIWSRFA